MQEELSDSASATTKQTPRKRAKGTVRMTLPEELRREEVVIEPTESVEDCVRIGEEVTEVLEIVPASFYVKRYIRPKYAKENGEGILIGILPDRVIEKGIPSESVIVLMTVDKYVRHATGQVHQIGSSDPRFKCLRLDTGRLGATQTALGAPPVDGSQPKIPSDGRNSDQSAGQRSQKRNPSGIHVALPYSGGPAGPV